MVRKNETENDFESKSSMAVVISVIIPTLQRKEVLLQTLRCFAQQDFKAFEIILVDQTPIHPPQIQVALEEFSQRGSFTWLRAEDWANLPAARNRGIEKAKGEIICFVDDDVILDANFLTQLLASYQESGADSVVGPVLMSPEGAIESVADGVAGASDPLAALQSRWLEGGRGCNMSFRRELFTKENFWFDPRFAGNALLEESDVFRRLGAVGKKVWLDARIPLIHLAEKAGGCREATFRDGKRLPKHFPLFFHNHILFAAKGGGGWRGICAGARQCWLLVVQRRIALYQSPFIIGAFVVGMVKFLQTTSREDRDWTAIAESQFRIINEKGRV